MRVLVTCPPMLGMKDQFLPIFNEKGLDVHCPNVIQTMSESELIELVPNFDGWIIGDDPATRRVFEAGKAGKLIAAVKWGIGVDNVDFQACKKLGIFITNTPNMFGNEVADIALGYTVALARETFFIDRSIREGFWPKNRGISLSGRKVGLIGYGDIGRCTANRLLAANMQVIIFDPGFDSIAGDNNIELEQWPARVDECDFLIFTCSLNESNHHMLNKKVMEKCKTGVRVVNVSRGPLIDEEALILALDEGKIHSAALDVFEEEPLPMSSKLRNHSLCIFGSHNSSNTTDAVVKTNIKAISELFKGMGIK